MRRFAALFICTALVLTCLSSVQAYEASVFAGAPRKATMADLYPREQAAGKTYYTEEYSFTVELEDKAKATIQFGFSNILGDTGSAFVNVTWKTEKQRAERVTVTLPKGKWSFSKTPFALNLGPAVFSGNNDELKLVVQGKKTTLELGFYPVVPGFVPGTGQVSLGNEGFIEMLVWPRLSVKGKVYDTKTQLGYHVNGWAILNHSTTTVPPQFQPPKWVLFRSNDPKNLLLFQAVQLPEAFGGGFYGWFVVYNDTKLVAQSTAMKITPLGDGNYGGRTVPTAFYAEDSVQKLAVGVRAVKFKRISDQLKKLPKLQRAIVAKYIHPVSYQFEGEVEIQLTVGQHFAFLPAVKTTRYKGFLKIDTVK